MKKLFAIMVLGLALSGCAQLKLLTQNYNNPITVDTLYTAENTAVIAFAALKAYKATCQSGAIPASCRKVVAKIQVKTRQLPKLLADLRGFVKNNDQVNARIVYNNAVLLFQDIKAIANANGIQVQ